MAKYSKRNIELSENKSKRRKKIKKIKKKNGQYGGASKAPESKPVKTTTLTNTKQPYKKIMKSINHEELTKYRNYKSYENISIEDINKHLENPLTTLETNILTKFKEQNNFVNNMFNEDLLQNRHLLFLKLTKINLKLSKIPSILEELINKFTNKNELSIKLNNSFEKSTIFRTFIKSISTTDDNSIDLNLIVLETRNIEGWGTIKQTSPMSWHVTNYNNLHENTTIPTKNIHNSNEKKDIDNYIKECNNLQKQYVTKHNEIIKLYNALKKIIELKLNLINIILSIMNVIEVNITKYGIIVNTKIDYDEDDGILKLPPILNTITDLLYEQQRKMHIVESIIPQSSSLNQQINNTQQGGGSTNSPQTQSSPISRISRNTNNPDQILINNFFDENIKKGQKVLFSIPEAFFPILQEKLNVNNNVRNQYNLKIKYDENNFFNATFITKEDDNYKFKVTQSADQENIPNKEQLINFFVTASEHIDPKYLIEYIDYVIPDVETYLIFKTIKQSIQVENQLLQKQYDKMDTFDNATITPNPPAESMKFTKHFKTEENKTVQKELKDKLQTIIYNCYDLQNLYLIKHIEFTNIFKMIIYYLDMFMVNMSIFYLVVLLFDIVKTKISEIITQPPGTEEPDKIDVPLPQDLINIKPLIKEQIKIIDDIIPQNDIDESNANSDESTSSTSSNSLNNNLSLNLNLNGGSLPAPETSDETQKYYKLINQAVLTNPEKFKNLEELENDIVEAEAKVNSETIFKAWLAIRILRLQKYLNNYQNENNKNWKKAETMLNKYKSLLDNNQTIDISEYVNEYASFISSEKIQQKIKNTYLKLPELDPNDTNALFIQEKLNLEKVLGEETCKRGDRACTEKGFSQSRELIKVFFGLDDKFMNEHFSDSPDFKFKYAVNELALYLLTLDMSIKNFNFFEQYTFENVINKLQDTNDQDFIRKKLKQIKEFSNTKIYYEEAKRQADATRKAEEEAKRKADEAAAAAAAAAANARKRAEEAEAEAKIKAAAEARRQAEEEEEKAKQSKKTIKLLKEKTDYYINHLGHVISIMKAFNAKTEDQKQNIISLLQSDSNTELITLFNNNIIKAYNELAKSQELLNIIDIDETVIDEKIEEYKKIIESASQYMTNVKAELFSDIYILINGTARIVLRIKPLKSNGPIIKPTELTNYDIKNFTTETQPNQQGGYNYNDIITVDNGIINIPDKLCKPYLSGTDLTTKSYGPFSAIYTHQYNNFHIYDNLFGRLTLNELINSTTKISTPDGKFNFPYNDEKTFIFDNINNNPQNLMAKLANNGSVVIFGYGFSGSGKTYSLIDGSMKYCETNTCNNQQGGAAIKPTPIPTPTSKTAIQAKPPSTRSTSKPQERKPAPAATAAVATAAAVAVAKPQVEQLPSKPMNFVQYDPSILEQFIKGNSDKITSIDFLELYPLGIFGAPNQKIIKSIVSDEETTYAISEIIDKATYDMYKLEVEKQLNSEEDTQIYNIDDSLACEGEGKSENYNLYKTINMDIDKKEIQKLSPLCKFYYITNRIRLLERHRIHKLRILATPNNNNSSRSFLQITINLKSSDSSKQPKLVFFDMPGTENTVRTRTEFMGNIFKNFIEDRKNLVFNQDNQDKQDTPLGNQQKNISERVLFDKHCTTTIITGIQIKNNSNDITIDSENTLFKYNFLTRILFSTMNIEFNNDKILGTIGREMAFFFNGIDYNSINKIKNNQKIKFLNDTYHNLIYKHFIKTFLNKKDYNSDQKLFYHIFDSKTQNQSKCKISKTITEEDKINIKNIFGLDLNGQKDDSDDFFYLRNKQHFPTTKNYYFDNEHNLIESSINNNTIVFLNPLIKYIYMILCYLRHKKSSNELLFIKVANFFIYKFINFIVKQGQGIVTTLEHLKFFFLFRADGITSYNNNLENEKNEKKEKNLTDKQNLENRKFSYVQSNINQPKTFKIKTKITDKVVIEENIEQGKLVDYRILSILQQLAGNESNLDKLNFPEGYNYPNLYQSPDETSVNNKLGSIFIMFTNIKIFLNAETDDLELESIKLKEKEKLASALSKICTAEYDTLEFAQSISATTITQPQLVTGGYKFNIRNKIYRTTKKPKSIKYIKNNSTQYYKRKTKINN